MKIAFVVQRYGNEVNGGAETLCREVAEHLVKFVDVDVITTCAIDYMTWKNEYPSGTETLNGVTVRRFPVDYGRNIRKFNKISEEIFCNPHSCEDDIEWMRQQGPYSSPLFDFIKENRDNYDVFIFITYLYCTTYFGLPLVADKSILVPTAHDEPPIYLSIFESLFQMPKGIIFNTEEEKRFVNFKFNNSEIPCDVIGTGIGVPDILSGLSFQEKFGITNFILYVGRIDESKGCKELFDFFIRYKTETKTSLKLVLMGKSVMKIPRDPDIINLGFVSDQDKYNGILASELVIMPSPFESLSMVLLEAWHCKIPVLVNGKCDVLKGQCCRSNAGLWYENYDEFKDCLDNLLKNENLQNKMGKFGKKYVDDNYNWDLIMKKYMDVFMRIFNDELSSESAPYPGRRLTTLSEVDDALRLCNEARKISESKFLEELGSFWLDFPPPVNDDPWSLEYRNYWLSMYEKISKRRYQIENEFFDFDVEYSAKFPYPFSTQDFHIVSKQLIAIGKIIEALALPPGSSILEMGAGWGNTSIFFAQMGYKVTVLDINEKYGELIRQRSIAANVDIDFVCMSFEEAIKLKRKFDCVLFYESFHHSCDHLKLLDVIPSLLVSGGILALAGEPIYEKILYDWGLNPAGEALWQIRTHGWFELVFRESYLCKTLERKGFRVKKFESPDNPAGTILICNYVNI